MKVQSSDKYYIQSKQVLDKTVVFAEVMHVHIYEKQTQAETRTHKEESTVRLF